MNAKKCPKCETVYTSTEEIIKDGGKTWNFGLALRGLCHCGGNLGAVNHLWRKKGTELPQAGKKVQNVSE